MPSTDKYHPFRYALQRPFAKNAASYWSSAVGTGMVVTTDALEGIQAIVYSGYNDALLTLPREQRPSTLDLLFDELNRAMTYGAFCANGRNIFDFDSQLLELFSHTDVSDIPASAIRLPFKNCYLAFGPREDLPLTGDRWVDGAYVFVQTIEDSEMLHIDLTTTSGRDVNRSPAAFILERDIRYHLAFNIAQDRSLSDIVTEALQSEEKELQAPVGYSDEFAKVAREVSQEGVELTSVREEGGRRRAAELVERFTVFRKTLNLVINALCYLTAYPDDPSLEWPADAPSSLVEKADHGATHKEKRRAESKLLPIGFTRVRFCRMSDGHAQSGIGVPGVKQHWRRGHWRNQAYGEKRALRRLIWIMPVLVGAESGDGSELGHIYTVQ